MDITHRVALSNGAVLSVEENPRRATLALACMETNGSAVDAYVCHFTPAGILVMPNSGDACYHLSYGLKKPEPESSAKHIHVVRLSNDHRLVIEEDPIQDMLHIAVQGPPTSLTDCCAFHVGGVLVSPVFAGNDDRGHWVAHLRDLRPAEGSTVYHTLTAEQKMAYLRIGAGCPHCASNDLEGGEVHCEGDHHYQTVSCNDCHRTWIDTYTLSDVTDGDDLCKLCKCTIMDGAAVVVDADLGGFRHAPGTCKIAPN